eukprot:4605125-Amphidinium_carterae.4
MDSCAQEALARNLSRHGGMYHGGPDCTLPDTGYICSLSIVGQTTHLWSHKRRRTPLHERDTHSAIWRKLAATMMVTHHQDSVAQFVGSRQYGIGVPNGTAAFAKTIAQLAEASLSHLFIESDIANAFGSVRRHTILEAV